MTAPASAGGQAPQPAPVRFLYAGQETGLADCGHAPSGVAAGPQPDSSSRELPVTGGRGDAGSGDEHIRVLRRRALRQLSREQHAVCGVLYEQVQQESPGLSAIQVHGRARTLLRHCFPGQYEELLATGHPAAGSELRPDTRTKSWQRATSRPAGRRSAEYQARFTQLRAEGMDRAEAYYRAMAEVRAGNPGLFERILAEERRAWVEVPGDAAPAGDGPVNRP